SDLVSGGDQLEDPPYLSFVLAGADGGIGSVEPIGSIGAAEGVEGIQLPPIGEEREPEEGEVRQLLSHHQSTVEGRRGLIRDESRGVTAGVHPRLNGAQRRSHLVDRPGGNLLPPLLEAKGSRPPERI